LAGEKCKNRAIIGKRLAVNETQTRWLRGCGYKVQIKAGGSGWLTQK